MSTSSIRPPELVAAKRPCSRRERAALLPWSPVPSFLPGAKGNAVARTAAFRRSRVNVPATEEIVLLPGAGPDPAALAIDHQVLGMNHARERDPTARPLRNLDQLDGDARLGLQALQPFDDPLSLAPVGRQQLHRDPATR